MLIQFFVVRLYRTKMISFMSILCILIEEYGKEVTHKR